MTKFLEGVRDWCTDLRTIYETDKVYGIEKRFDLSIFALSFFALSRFLQFFWGKKGQDPRWFIEAYVLTIVVVPMFLLCWSNCWSATVASYLLASTFVVLFNVVFLSKLLGPVQSNERTLLFFLLNVIQVVLTFAILYRVTVPNLSYLQAIFKALLVFSTISYPKESEVVAGLQIVVDFVLLAVFLSHFVGRLGSTKDHDG
jgi:hypothetical protein